MTKFNLVDSPMGTGKTTAIIEYLQDNYPVNSNKKFIVCVMYKGEQTRYEKELQNAVMPDANRNITIQVKNLLKQGKNIITTHAMLDRFDKEIIDILRNTNYKYDLFIDEQPKIFLNTVSDTTISFNPIDDEDTDDTKLLKSLKQVDIYYLFNNKILTIMDGQCLWNCGEDNIYNYSQKGLFYFLKDYLEYVSVYAYGENDYNPSYPSSLILLKNINVFNCFHNVWVLSYLLKDSMIDNYLALNKVSDIEYYHIENNILVKGYEFSFPNSLDRLNIAPERYVMDISLSKTSYDKLDGDRLLQLVHNFKNYRDSISKNYHTQDYYLATYKEYSPNNSKYTSKLKSIAEHYKRYVSKARYISCNAKATNEYQDSYIVGYLVDRHFNPLFINLLSRYDITFNKKLFALSEMLQFIWRSNIRVDNSDKQVYVYVAGNYSYKLLKLFLNRDIAFWGKL